MRKGDVTPDTLGIVVLTVGFIVVGFIMFTKTTKEFAESFVGSSSKVVAMDIASLMSLSAAAKEVRMEYEVPTETVKFRVSIVNNYVTVQRIDESYCKEEEQPLSRKVSGEEPIKEQEFCKASAPVLYTYTIHKNLGNRFVMEKVNDRADFYAE